MAVKEDKEEYRIDLDYGEWWWTDGMFEDDHFPDTTEMEVQDHEEEYSD